MTRAAHRLCGLLLAFDGCPGAGPLHPSVVQRLTADPMAWRVGDSMTEPSDDTVVSARVVRFLCGQMQSLADVDGLGFALSVLEGDVHPSCLPVLRHQLSSLLLSPASADARSTEFTLRLLQLLRKCAHGDGNVSEWVLVGLRAQGERGQFDVVVDFTESFVVRTMRCSALALAALQWLTILMRKVAISNCDRIASVQLLERTNRQLTILTTSTDAQVRQAAEKCLLESLRVLLTIARQDDQVSTHCARALYPIGQAVRLALGRKAVAGSVAYQRLCAVGWLPSVPCARYELSSPLATHAVPPYDDALGRLAQLPLSTAVKGLQFKTILRCGLAMSTTEDAMACGGLSGLPTAHQLLPKLRMLLESQTALSFSVRWLEHNSLVTSHAHLLQ